MFQVNDDLSIYVTRGDMVYLSVTAENNGEAYTFEPGEVLRIKVFGKKDAEDVVLQKDFPVTAVTQSVDIILDESDTKIGEVISKPRDYWYEVELNPGDNPQTIIGYDEDGPRVFKLFPEGDDIPAYVPDPEVIKVIDTELDMTSERPVQNQVIARAFANLQAGYQATHEAVAALHVTPEMFGAIGDGVADDTKAIQATFDADGNTISLNGTYRIRSGRTLLLNKAKTIIGGTLLFESYETFDNAIPGVAVNADNCRFEGVTFRTAAQDQIPSVNRKNGSTVGLSANVTAVCVNGSNCVINACVFEDIIGVLTNAANASVSLLNSKMIACDMGVVNNGGVFVLDNCDIDISSRTGLSGYYHPIYCYNINGKCFISKVRFTADVDYNSSVLHFNSTSGAYDNGSLFIIRDITCDEHFDRIIRVNHNKVIIDGVTGTFNAVGSFEGTSHTTIKNADVTVNAAAHYIFNSTANESLVVQDSKFNIVADTPYRLVAGLNNPRFERVTFNGVWAMGYNASAVFVDCQFNMERVLNIAATGNDSVGKFYRCNFKSETEADYFQTTPSGTFLFCDCLIDGVVGLFSGASSKINYRVRSIAADGTITDIAN